VRLDFGSSGENGVWNIAGVPLPDSNKSYGYLIVPGRPRPFEAPSAPQKWRFMPRGGKIFTNTFAVLVSADRTREELPGRNRRYDPSPKSWSKNLPITRIPDCPRSLPSTPSRLSWRMGDDQRNGPANTSPAAGRENDHPATAAKQISELKPEPSVSQKKKKKKVMAPGDRAQIARPPLCAGWLGERGNCRGKPLFPVFTIFGKNRHGRKRPRLGAATKRNKFMFCLFQVACFLPSKIRPLFRALVPVARRAHTKISAPIFGGTAVRPVPIFFFPASPRKRRPGISILSPPHEEIGTNNGLGTKSPLTMPIASPPAPRVVTPHSSSKFARKPSPVAASLGPASDSRSRWKCSTIRAACKRTALFNVRGVRGAHFLNGTNSSTGRSRGGAVSVDRVQTPGVALPGAHLRLRRVCRQPRWRRRNLAFQRFFFQ